MDEQVNIVNDKDEIIGVTSKIKAHEKGLLHRTVIGEVKNSKGEWFFVKQSASRQDPGQLVSPVGGHVKADETEEEAIIRESKEELGISEFEYRLVDKVIFNREVLDRKENHYFIVYEIEWNGKLKLNHESDDFEKFTTDELKTALKNFPDKFGAPLHFLIKNLYPFLLS